MNYPVDYYEMNSRDIPPIQVMLCSRCPYSGTADFEYDEKDNPVNIKWTAVTCEQERLQLGAQGKLLCGYALGNDRECQNCFQFDHAFKRIDDTWTDGETVTESATQATEKRWGDPANRWRHADDKQNAFSSCGEPVSIWRPANIWQDDDDLKKKLRPEDDKG